MTGATADRADTALRAIERARASAGDAIGRDPAVARKLLEEHLPQDLTAVSVLVAAVRDGVPDRLSEDLPGNAPDPVLARLADSLAAHESLAPERARWAVAVWAVALGLAQAAPSAPAAAPATAPGTVASGPTAADAAPTTPITPQPAAGRTPAGPRRRRLLLPLIIAGAVVAALVVVGGGTALVLRLTSARAPAPATKALPTAPLPRITSTPTPTALPPIEVAAHRGGNETYPLETAEAMLDATKRPGVAVETDMRFTSDGVPVLVHDEATASEMPCTGGVSHPKVADKTYAWLSANCRTLASASPSGGRFRIPKVEDVARGISAIPGAQWLLEIKTTLTPQQETLVFDLLQRYGMVDRTVLTSFIPAELAKAKDEAARRKHPIRLLQFVGNTALTAPTAAKNGLWAVGVQSTVLTKDYVSALHGAGVKAIAWTPDTANEWQKAQTAGADLVITDRPVAWLTWHTTGKDPGSGSVKPRTGAPAPVRPAAPPRSAPRPSPSALPSAPLTTPVPTPLATP